MYHMSAQGVDERMINTLLLLKHHRLDSVRIKANFVFVRQGERHCGNARAFASDRLVPAASRDQQDRTQGCPRNISPNTSRSVCREIFHQTHPAVFAAKYFSARRPHFHPGNLNVCRAHKDSLHSVHCVVTVCFVCLLFFVVCALADWSRLFRGVAKSCTERVRHVPRF